MYRTVAERLLSRHTPYMPRLLPLDKHKLPDELACRPTFNDLPKRRLTWPLVYPHTKKASLEHRVSATLEQPAGMLDCKENAKSLSEHKVKSCRALRFA
jgi:hypothetical protein